MEPIYHILNKNLGNMQKHGATNKNSTTTAKYTYLDFSKFDTGKI
jgi:hypothetical protein